ncbi:MAG: hypothetical protein AB7K09_11770 [Planctomycetota bacterium]
MTSSTGPEPTLFGNIEPIGQTAFREVMSCRYDAIAQAIVGAADSVLQFMADPVAFSFRAATISSAINDQIVAVLSDLFAGDPDVSVIERNGHRQPGFIFANSVEVRVNKLDSTLRPPRQRTDQDRDYREHRQLALFKDLPRVVLGYRARRPASLGIGSIHFVHWVGDVLEWTESLALPQMVPVDLGADDEAIENFPYSYTEPADEREINGTADDQTA